MSTFLAATARRLAGLAFVALLTAGVPYALIRYVGWPLPHQVPTWQDFATTLTSPLTDTMIGNAIACLLWLAWAAFIWSLVAEVTEAVAGIRLPQPRAIAPARGLAALLVAAITGGVLATAAQAAPTFIQPAGGTVPAVAATANAADSASSTTTRPAITHPHRPDRETSALAETRRGTHDPMQLVAGHVTLVSAGQRYTCQVTRGDTLSGIARQWLGDANRWPEIFALNRGTHFRDVGGTLTNPHLIYPGWTLELPDDATPPAGSGATRPDQPAPDPPTPAPPPPADQPPSEPLAPSPPASPSTPPLSDDDDGVVEPAAPADVAATPAGPPPTTDTSTGDSPAEHQTPTPPPETSPGVPLGTGSWLDLGLVAAILAAVALVWAHRRRRYVPAKPTPRLRLEDPSVAPMPGVITRIRRGLHRSPPPTPRTSPDTPLDTLPIEPRPDEPDPDDDGTAVDAGVPQPVTPALSSPLIEVWPPAGLGLIGPGADAAARGFLVSALAAGGLDEPNSRGHVVIPAGTLATLLGAAAVGVPDTPRLTVTGGLTDALTLLEEQTLHRTRVCFDHEVDTVSALRDADPMAEPLPPIVLITDTTAAHERARIAAVLTQGQRLDIHGILLGAWPDGDTVTVAGDGSTRPADSDAHRHGRHPADIGRLTVIDPTEAADLLRVLAESHTGEPQPPAPTERPPLPDTTTPGDPAAGPDPAAAHNDEKATPSAELAAPGDHRPTPTVEPTIDVSDSAASAPGHDTDHDRADREDTSAPRDGTDPHDIADQVKVQILGDARIIDVDTTQPLRGKSLELLVYLAVRGGTVSRESILDDLLPEATTSKAPHRLHTYVYNLRRVLKRTGGTATYLSHPDQRYTLHRDTVDVDLWRMSDALDHANRAATPADRIAALRRAVDTYQGPLARGKDYEWIEPYREAVQRQAADAALALADALADHPADALTVLTTAISHHPYAEPLYQAAMRVHAALGDATAIRDLHRQLARALDGIDTEVSDDTTSIARSLVNQLGRHRPVSKDST
ncbi:BTAD domain-containing putative transcriptional regulator [Micromonospora sp. WMMD1082]|uniref:BTAD domain-containing putative transcriptional regulator n=1 Tax=Micromonospora sp. WMMD1082 TaxID=3016104 RepID=UPI002415D90B|nr:BTAD domain-containing putative transcriptional regulator [Micromonospora sp. WMMD1082]MDG4795013.1 BTAD domain-containing putative transcriptional regulator [Micromonospora sp. WMMD1082]